MEKNKLAKILLISLFTMFFSCNNDDNQVEVPISNEETNEKLPDNEPPLSFDLIKVKKDEIVLDLSPTFSWERAEDPEKDEVTYDFYLAKKGEELKIAVANLTDTKLEYDLSFAEEYYWKVVAKDDKGAETDSETFFFRTRDLRQPRKISEQAAFGARIGHSIVSFGDRLLLINGRYEKIKGLSEIKKDFWYSDNATDWVKLGDAAPFGHRYFSTPLQFNEKLFIVGGTSSTPPSSTFGSDTNAFKNDVWASIDGLDWLKVQTHANFTPRAGHSLVAFRDKMWMYGGGEKNSIILNDLYVSDDGLLWSKIDMSSENLTPRANAKFIVFKDKLYLIGGSNNGVLLKEIWESDNGLNWSLIAEGDEVPSSIFFDVFVYRDKLIWVNRISGEDKIRYSNDAKTWVPFKEGDLLSRREGLATVLHNDKIYLVGGRDIAANNSVGPYKSDIWVFD